MRAYLVFSKSCCELSFYNRAILNAYTQLYSSDISAIIHYLDNYFFFNMMMTIIRITLPFVNVYEMDVYKAERIVDTIRALTEVERFEISGMLLLNTAVPA